MYVSDLPADPGTPGENLGIDRVVKPGDVASWSF